MILSCQTLQNSDHIKVALYRSLTEKSCARRSTLATVFNFFLSPLLLKSEAVMNCQLYTVKSNSKISQGELLNKDKAETNAAVPGVVGTAVTISRPTAPGRVEPASATNNTVRNSACVKACPQKSEGRST